MKQHGSQTQLRLKRRGGTLVIGAGAWRELLDVARKHGWEPEHAPGCYWGDIGLEVAADDAARLATTLMSMGDSLLQRQEQSPQEDVAELLEDLEKLVAFCSTGGFRVC